MSGGNSSSTPGNPFPGLRPFDEKDADLFFGREHQVDSMVDILAKRHFLAVVGTSGSGKSSLVNCGLLPALHQGLMASAGTNWRIVKFRPGDQPIKAMADAMAKDGVLFSNFEAQGLPLVDIVDTTLRMSTVGLLDIVEQASRKDPFNLLVVVDQFEELFRFRQLASSDPTALVKFSEEVTAFVSLLLAVLEQPEQRIHIVLTMRSDFLGDCTQFHELAEAINTSLYLVPRLTRDERRDAITNPILMREATISPVLVTRLVNDVGDNPDQLSILQHALNRTWARWQQLGGVGPLDLPHYEAIGTMAEALDRHAEEAFAELAEPGPVGDHSSLQKLCRRTFQALTDKASDGRGIRRPTKWITLRGITNASGPQLLKVIEVFREPSRSFLMPPAGTPIDNESVIDISHESLMRVWRRLSSWGDEEARWADNYRRLAEAAVRHREGSESLLRDPALQIALNWWQSSQPNEAWASRYHPGFQVAKIFLDRSAEARAEEQEFEQRERAQRRKRERNQLIRNRLYAISAVAFAVFMWFQYDQANRQVARTWSAVAAGLMKEHQVDPESSIKFALAALNSPLGTNPSESVKLIVNLINAIELYGELSLSDGETSKSPLSIWSLANVKDNQLVSAGEKGSFRIWQQQNLRVRPRLVDANLGDPVFLRLANDNIIVAGVLAKDVGKPATDKKDAVRVQLWNSDLTRKLADKSPRLGGIKYIKQIPSYGDLVIADLEGNLALWRQDLSSIRSVSTSGDIRGLAVLQPRGDILVSVKGEDGNRLQLWSADLLAKIEDVELGKDYKDTIDSLLQLENRLIVSGGYDGSLQLWSSGLRRIGPRTEAQSRQILSLAQLENLELISGSADGTLRRWLVRKDGLSALHLPFPADQAKVQTLLAVNSTLISGGSNGTLKRWQWARSSSANQLSDPTAIGYEVVMASLNDGGEIYRLRSMSPTGKDKELETVDAGNKQGRPKRTFLLGAGSSTILSLLRLNNGDLATGDYSGSLQRWRFNGKDWVRKGYAYQETAAEASCTSKPCPNPIWSMTQLRNGDLVLGMQEGRMRRIRFKGEGRWVAQGRLCGPPEANKDFSPEVLGSSILSLVTLEKGDLVSGSKSGTIVRWHHPDQKWCQSPSIIPGGSEPEIFSMTELNDGTMLSSTGSGGLTLWKWGKNSANKVELETIYLKGSNLIANVVDLPETQELVIADFQGNYKTYPGQKEAIALGCNAIKKKLYFSKKERSLKPYEEKAERACESL